MPKKLTLKEVSERFKEGGCELMAAEYDNASKKKCRIFVSAETLPRYPLMGLTEGKGVLNARRVSLNE